MNYRQCVHRFTKFAKTYDFSIGPVKYKYYHTFRVVKYAVFIAKRMGLDAENVALAKVVALLHDLARFEQWTKYATFEDSRSFDHGDLAVKMLFDDGLISEFEIEEKYYPAIRFAVANHNKYAIGAAAVPSGAADALLHARIIRDADKIDIIASVINGRINEHDRDNLTGVSPDVREDIKVKRPVDRRKIKTAADGVLALMSFYFDLETDAAREVFKRRRFINGIYRARAKHLCPADAQAVKNIADEIG